MRKIGRGIARADEPEDVVHESPLMAKDERPEGVTIAAKGLIDQTFVGKARQVGKGASNGGRGREWCAHGSHSAL